MKPIGWALVTGASRGIGECFARALAGRSWDVILVARTKDRLEHLAGELSSSFGIRAEAVAMDLTARGAAMDLSGIVAERGFDIELLVNNAGFGDRGQFSKLPADEQSGMIHLNAVALVELTHCLLPPMLSRRRGSIINVSSTAGFQPMPYAAVYAATKAFVTSFSMALAEELRSQGIAVVTLCPGPTRTEPQESPSTFPGGRQPAEEVVAAALRQVDQRGGLVIPRLINRLMAFSNRFLPLHLSAKAVSRMTRPRDT